jgi:hypothetical protein
LLREHVAGLISGSYLLFGAGRAGCRGSGAEDVV